MFNKIAKVLGMDPNKREVDRLSQIVAEVNQLEAEFEQLSDEALRAKTDEFRARIAEYVADEEDEKQRHKLEQEALEEILPEAFATVR